MVTRLRAENARDWCTDLDIVVRLRDALQRTASGHDT
jgi:hypothetical protein